MGNLWLRDLPEYVRAEGVACTVAPGAETRSRSSGGYDRLMGVGVHHDASGTATTTAQIEAWSTRNSPDRPIGLGTVTRHGSARIWAMGATNTQGRGGPRWTSRGVIPVDNGNRNIASWEAMNNGVGERWSESEQWAYPRVVAATIKCINALTPNETPLGAGDVFAHFEWAPGRKFDPAGPSQWAPRGGLWNLDEFRGSVFTLLDPTPPPPTTGDDDVFDGLWQHGSGIFAVYKCGYKVWLPSAEILEAKRKLCVVNGWDDTIRIEADPGMFRAFGPVLGPQVPGCDGYGVPL